MILCDITLYRSKAEIPQKSHPVNMLLINKSLEVHATNKIKKGPVVNAGACFFRNVNFILFLSCFREIQDLQW